MDLQTEIKNLQGEVKISRWNLSSSRVQITLAVPPPPSKRESSVGPVPVIPDVFFAVTYFVPTEPTSHVGPRTEFTTRTSKK